MGDNELHRWSSLILSSHQKTKAQCYFNGDINNRNTSSSRLPWLGDDSNVLSSLEFEEYNVFPLHRYTMIRSWDIISIHKSKQMRRDPLLGESTSYIAFDTVTNQHVLLSIVSVKKRHLNYIIRVMKTISRHSGFQRLLDIWYHVERSAYVFVQTFDLSWFPLSFFHEVYNESLCEDDLRNVVFQVVSFLHFLHHHQWSAVGHLCLDAHLMIHIETRVLTWVISPSLLTRGCLLFPATNFTVKRDIAAIGLLMLQLSLPLSKQKLLPQLNESVDWNKILHKRVSHLSSGCQVMILSCLTQPLSIDSVLRMKWLRPIEFIPCFPKRSEWLHDQIASPWSTRWTIRSVLWNLVKFIVGRFDDVHKTTSALPTSIVGEEEEMETKSRKKSKFKRWTSFLTSLTSPHYLQSRTHRSIDIGSTLIKQGMVIVPQLIPHTHQEEYEKLKNIPKILLSEPQRLVPTYDSFDEDNGIQTYFSTSDWGRLIPPYDSFDEDSGFMLECSEQDGLCIHQDASLLHENDFSTRSINSMTDLRKELTRSLAIPDEETSTTASQSDSKLWAHVTEDAVHFSAFGPTNLAWKDRFRIDIWAYLRQQRTQMVERALEQNETESFQRFHPMRITRGTLITVSIEPSNHFHVDAMDETSKSFRWQGEISGVSFTMQRSKQFYDSSDEEDGDDLCIARVIAGTKVSLLYIRLCEKSGTVINLREPGIMSLSTRLEHLTAHVPQLYPSDLEIIRPIGKGAFGEAVLATWKTENRLVVIKKPHDNVYGDDVSSDEFLHEASVMQMLGSHPHVVEFLGLLCSSEVENNMTGIVTEYVSNGSLQHVISDNSFNIFTRTLMARDAAHGILNIHQGHVIHRDIAARNCLVDEQFRVKVCDFGLSRFHVQGRRYQYLFDDQAHGFGPVKWMAPESIVPPHVFSQHSDTYMFGVLLYEIFSGQLPFSDLSSQEAVALIMEGEHVPIPSYLPKHHQDLMKACFDPHPLFRPTMDDLYTRLDEWILYDTIHTLPRQEIGIL